ncbi:MAG: MFS transporter [Phycisphaerae bacterium]
MAQLTIQQAFEVALGHQQAGRLAEAEGIYRQILASQPGHADSLHMLGLIAYQVGRHAVAADLIRQAIARNPNYPVAYCNLGNILTEMGKGRLEEAVAACRRALALMPNFPEAYSNLGNALRAQGLLDEALGAYRQAIALRPEYPEAHNNLDNVLRDKGLLQEAGAACRQAMALRPNFSEAYSNLGNVLGDQGKWAEASVVYRQAIALKPNMAEAHYNLGNSLLRQNGNRQLAEANAAYRQAIALKPDYAEAYNNLGTVLRGQGQLVEATAAFREACTIKPDYADACNNLGVVLQDQGLIAEATAAYRRAIALKGDYADAHYNLALILLLQGDFAAGWKEHEWRWQIDHFRPHHWKVPQPLWDGSDLQQRTILLHAEQGFGDTLQFIRYVPLVAAAFSLAALLMTYFTLPESHHPGEMTEDARRFSVGGLRRALQRPVIAPLMWMSFVYGVAFAGMEQTLSLLIQIRNFPEENLPQAVFQHGGSAASKATGYLFCGIGVIIALIQGGAIHRLTKRFGGANLVIVGSVLVAAGLAIIGMPLPGRWTGIVVGCGILAVGSSLFNPSIQALISRHAGAQEQGAILGANAGLASLARVAGPVLAGVLFEYGAGSERWPGLPYYVSAVITVGVAGAAIIQRRRLVPKEG